MFGRGKGLSEYKNLSHVTNLERDEKDKIKAKSVNAYSTTRFTSSAIDLFQKVYESYEALLLTFREYRESTKTEVEMKYLINCFDLCVFLDVLRPIKEIMVKCQGLETPCWSVHLWWPKVKTQLNMTKNCLENQLKNPTKNVLDDAVLPTLHEHFSKLWLQNKEEIKTTSEKCT